MVAVILASILAREVGEILRKSMLFPEKESPRPGKLPSVVWTGVLNTKSEKVCEWASGALRVGSDRVRSREVVFMGAMKSVHENFSLINLKC